MATGFKNQSAGGMGFDPRSSDPANPKAGDIQVSDGTVRAKGLWEYKNGGWSQVGAGNTDLAVYRQFDAEDGDVTSFTNITISSTSPLNKLNSYVVGSYTANFPSITLFERHKDKLHGIELFYKMTSGTARLVVKDNASNTLVSQGISSTVVQKASLQFYVNSSVTAVQLFIEDVSSATGLKIDDVKFTDSPFVSTDLLHINSVSLAGSDGRSITANTESIYWVGSGTGWTTGADGSTPTSGNYYTVQYNNSLISLQGAIDNSGGGYAGAIRLYKNGSSYKLLAENTGDRIRSFCYNSKEGEFAVGDKLAFVVSTGITVNNTSIDHYLNIVEQAASENLVFSRSGTENEFRADIAPTNSITKTNVSGIFTTVSRSGFTVTVGLLAGAFTVSPGINALHCLSNNSTFARNVVVTTTSITFDQYDDANATVSADRTFALEICNVGADYKNPNAYAVVAVENSIIKLIDGVPAPSTQSYAQIYIDQADGDLKIKFADGFVRTIGLDS